MNEDRQKRLIALLDQFEVQGNQLLELLDNVPVLILDGLEARLETDEKSKEEARKVISRL